MKQKNAAGSANKGQITELTPRANSPSGHAFCQDERAAEVSGVGATADRLLAGPRRRKRIRSAPVWTGDL